MNSCELNKRELGNGVLIDGPHHFEQLTHEGRAFCTYCGKTIVLKVEEE